MNELPYWQRQAVSTPLFPDMLWSRPENKAFAGKLAIIGGHAQSFAAPAEAFSSAEQAGIGVARVLLPDVLQKTVGRIFAAGEYAPSTPSGSFSQQALAELIALASWGDGMLLAGDLGNNSETAILLERFISKYSGQLTITKDAADYAIKLPEVLRGRPDTLLVISFAQLQKLATALHFTHAFTFDMDLLRLISQLHDFTQQTGLNITVKHLQNIVVAVNGKVSTTKFEADIPIWRVRLAAQASVWWLQNPTKPFEALSTSVIE